jgi:hypothetical protein
MRIQYELSEKENAEIEKMMEDTAISTKRDLFNNALTLFEWAIKEIKKGRVIAAIDEKENRYIALVMPSLSKVQPN